MLKQKSSSRDKSQSSGRQTDESAEPCGCAKYTRKRKNENQSDRSVTERRSPLMAIANLCVSVSVNNTELPAKFNLTGNQVNAQKNTKSDPRI